MNVNAIQTIGILGSGVMGSGIALVTAQAGYSTLLFDIYPSALQKAQVYIEKFTQSSVEKAKITPEERMEMLNRIVYTTELRQIQVDCIIEAVVEKIEVKWELFEQLEQWNKEETIFATNTSSLSVTQIASRLKNPQRCGGMHFFNPAPLMKLVEIVAGAQTSQVTITLLQDLAIKLGKTPALVADIPGFIVNRVARHYYLESLRIAEENVASIETIDTIMEATGFRMGPFKLMDLIGVDTNHQVTQSIYAGYFYAPRFRPSVLQQKKVEAGHLGRKSGKGFYNYESQAN
ncbi:MAG: 3-hydroxyacyl-CoA dehydrogenase NAD-binding domain-containing protein [Bacteroidia bacterium]|nr:3-hydroxyacyl-CoA dehydrogenase NAD-binding domain-containing protein [Bacteroidia bacterium]MDW8159697.1 3-hydroxyacyl-CoA dehydrogenase NAD-binding domain-containing protein [Bacteroidia bacterium]